MMQDNNWYGHRSILAEFCDIDDRPSFSSIQHGWSIIYNNGDFGKKNSFFPYLCWSKIVEENSKKKGFHNIYSIGSPFLYLCSILDKRESNNKKSQGTILFPPHNTPTIKDSETNHKKLIENIEKSCEPPFTACLYYSDFIDKNISIYKKKNWRVVTCGPRGDNKMLFKLYNELSSHNSVVVCEITTVMFYAMYLKKKVKFINKIDDQIISERSSDKIKENYLEYQEELNDYLDFESKFIKQYPQIISDFLEADIGFEISKLQLGYDSMLNKNKLKKVLGWSSVLKKILSFFIFNYFNIKYGSKVRSGEIE